MCNLYDRNGKLKTNIFFLHAEANAISVLFDMMMQNVRNVAFVKYSWNWKGHYRRRWNGQGVAFKVGLRTVFWFLLSRCFLSPPVWMVGWVGQQLKKPADQVLETHVCQPEKGSQSTSCTYSRVSKRKWKPLSFSSALLIERTEVLCIFARWISYAALLEKHRPFS